MNQTMKKAFSTFSILFLIVAVAYSQSQFPSQIWHKGNIYDLKGEGRGGLVKYDLDNNLVQLKVGDAIETYTASNVSYFELFDEVYGGLRKFYSLPYALTNDYETPVFFEVLTEGNSLALLCREFIATDSRGMNNYGMMGGYGMSPYYSPQMVGGNKLAFNYYFFRDGRIEKYSLKKKDLFEMLPNHDEELDLFIRKNRLDYDKRGDLLRITAYYNQLI